MRSLSTSYKLSLVVHVVSGIVSTVIPLFLRQFIDSISRDNLSTDLIIWVSLLFLIQAVIQVIANYFLAKGAEDFVMEIRNRLLKRLVHGKMSDMERLSSGDTASHLINDTGELKSYYGTFLPNFVTGLFVLIFSLFFLIKLDWKLTVFLFLSIPFLILVITPLANMNRKNSQEYQSSLGKMMGLVVETIREISYIKANQMEAYQVAKVESHTDKIRERGLKTNFIDALASPLIMMVLLIMISVIFTYGGVRVAQGTLTIGTLISFLVYLFQLLNPIGSISSFFNQRAKLEGVQEELAQLEAIETEDYSSGNISPFQGDLSLSDVSFAYDEELVIQNITTNFPLNQKVSIVGPSGSGKTTLLSLLLRFYPVSQGSIQMGNTDIEDMNLEMYRRNFSYVGQRGGLVMGTIRDNLIAGLTEEPTDQSLQSSLEQANLWQEIQAMPHGLDTMVGEGGSGLSGGQGQRLQIARAFLRKTPIVIFDEATSQLDADSERKINESLDELKKHTTLIVIAHRISTVIDSDLILFLEDGEITGQDNHEALYQSHTAYQRYVDLQMLGISGD